MSLYKYVAKNMEGKTVAGVLEAADKGALVSKLREKDLVIVSVTETKGGEKAGRALFSKRGVKLDDIVIFSRQLATMVEAGIPLVSALDILGEQTENRTFSNVTLNVRDAIETGSSLSDALAKHANVFSQLFVNMVKAGESSGMLDEILDRLASYLEKTSTLQKKIKSALIYPSAVTLMALAITIFLLIKVVPVAGRLNPYS